MKLVIRGAIQVKNDTKEEINCSVAKLFREIIRFNKLDNKDINYVLLSQTNDLVKQNAATAVRLALDINEVPFPLFCCQEAYVENTLPRTIRIMVVTDRDIVDRSESKHVYLDGAQTLRPDLSIKEETSN